MRISKGFSAFLDAARWIAALAVLAGHLRQLVFVSLPEQGAGVGAGWKCFYFLTGYGHQAVLIFFVLSGYLIGGSVLHELRQGTFRWRLYLVKRLSRIYPVFLVALLCGLVLDHVGLAYFNASGIYTHTSAYSFGSLEVDASSHLGLDTLAGNLLMLQTVTVLPLGTNGPLWSLCNEFWYYLLFPLAAVLVGRREYWIWKVCYVVFLAALVNLLPAQILLYFLVWLMGAAAAAVRRFPVPAVLPGLACAAALACSRLWPSTPVDFLIAVCFTLFLCAVREKLHEAPRGARLNKALADFSYSLYALHFPLLILAGAVLHDTLGIGIAMQPGWVPAALYGALLAAAVGYSFLLSLISERQTPRIRDTLLFLWPGPAAQRKSPEPVTWQPAGTEPTTPDTPGGPLERASA